MEQVTARQAMQRIDDHIRECATNYEHMNRTFGEVRESIKSMNSLMMGFMSAVFVAVLAFAGYTYTQSQALNAQLERAQIAAATAASAAQKIPDETVQKLSQTVSPTPQK